MCWYWWLSIAGISRGFPLAILIPIADADCTLMRYTSSMKALCTQRDDYIKTYDTGIIIISEDIELSM